MTNGDSTKARQGAGGARRSHCVELDSPAHAARP